MAGLNLGDCFADTLAKASGEPLLPDGHPRSWTALSIVSDLLAPIPER